MSAPTSSASSATSRDGRPGPGPRPDGLVVVASYAWDGRQATPFHAVHYLLAAWWRVVGGPALLVNPLAWARLRRWPLSIRRFPPGLRRTSPSGPAVLNVYGPDWRERSALGLPVPAEALARRVRRATRALSMERPVVLVGDPSHGRLLGRCGESAGVYHCTDDFAAGDPAHADSIRRDEDATVAAADVVLCVSEPLKDRLAPRARRTLVLPNAVDVEAMRRFAAEPAPPRGWVSPPGPRVVYAGYLNRRVDVEALAHAVAANPSLSFVFVGAGRPPGGTGDALGALAAAPNAYWLGWRDRRDLAWIVSRCDLGLVPYRLDEFNRSCSPLKVHEYAALGVPVLATPIPATAGLGDAIRVADAGSFAAAIPEELAAAPARRVLLDALVMPHSWDLRAETVAAALGVLPRPVADR